MFSSSSSYLILALCAFASTVHGHGAITEIKGANGVTASAIGILASTPRNGSGRTPFQQDTSTIRDREIASGRAGACGRTIAGGNNDVAAGVEAASSAGLPSMGADGSVQMTLHQINQDGGGPYTCDISTDASGTNFQPMTVTTNVPGVLGFSAATAKDFPLVAQAPAGTTCTGGPNGDACLVRCRNNTPAGPFGGCAVVTSSAGGAATAAGAATGAGAGAGAGANTGSAAAAGGNAGGARGGRGGRLSQLLGAFNKRLFGGDNVQSMKKRVVGSRIVERAQAGKWI